MNIFNVAVGARMFLFFSYPSKMTGDAVWVASHSIFGLGNTLPDTFTTATPLAHVAQGTPLDASVCDMVTGFIPGCIGETSVIAIAIGAVILLWTGIASWKTMLSVFVGGSVMGAIFHATGASSIEWWVRFLEHTQKVQLYSKKDIEYNLTRLQRYVLGQAGASTLTYIKCVGLEHFMNELKEKSDSLTDLQLQLILEWEAIKQNRFDEFFKTHPRSVRK